MAATSNGPDLREAFLSSASPVTLDNVQVTDVDIARVPVTNLRVPRAEFGALWAAAERLSEQQGKAGGADWYAAGVVVTCRWLAGAATRLPNGRATAAHSPITRSTVRAYEELVDAECLAAERLLAQSPPPALMARRPGWVEGVAATLRWAWRHQGAPPLAVQPQHRG